jgi:hypothetical protein
MENWFDSNTGIYYSGFTNRTLQAGKEHIFLISFADIFGNEVKGKILLNPPYVVEFSDQIGL